MSASRCPYSDGSPTDGRFDSRFFMSDLNVSHVLICPCVNEATALPHSRRRVEITVEEAEPAGSVADGRREPMLPWNSPSVGPPSRERRTFRFNTVHSGNPVKPRGKIPARDGPEAGGKPRRLFQPLGPRPSHRLAGRCRHSDAAYTHSRHSGDARPPGTRCALVWTMTRRRAQRASRSHERWSP